MSRELTDAINNLEQYNPQAGDKSGTIEEFRLAKNILLETAKGVREILRKLRDGDYELPVMDDEEKQDDV